MDALKEAILNAQTALTDSNKTDSSISKALESLNKAIKDLKLKETVTPEEPVVPEEPTVPTEPEKPVTPDKPSATEKPEDSNETLPGTGVSSNAVLVSVSSIVAGLFIVLINRKKKKEQA